MIWVAVALVLLVALREAQFDRERKDWTQERRLLLTRIQAPHMAPTLASGDEETPEPSWLAPDDDEGFRKLLAERDD